MQTKTAYLVAEGVVAALVAHLAITVVLTVGDLVTGRGVLFTPTLLGTALLNGATGDCQVPVGGATLLAYASVHMVTLTLFGLMASALVQGSERRPILWFGGLMLFVLVAWHLAAAVLTVLGPVLQCVSLWWIVAASFAGAIGMGVYLWRAHPSLAARLRGDRYA
jgi:hypothetical protein